MRAEQRNVPFSGYYSHFPPKSFGVKVETHRISDISKKILVLTKDVKAGEVIYEEYPIVAVLDTDLQTQGTYCTQCLRTIEPSMSIKSPESPAFEAIYCSVECQKTAKSQYHNLLFTLEPPLPPHIPAEPVTPENLEARRKAHTQYADYLKTTAHGHSAPLLVARFIARQVASEMSKLIPDTTQPASSTQKDYTGADGGDYLLADHFERLRYLEVTPPKEELELITAVLETVLPGLNSFVTDERYATLVAKMAYNTFGVYYDGGRDDKPIPSARPEDIERTRIPVGTSRQVGSAVYTVSSYLAHSCDPNARPEFTGGTAQLHLIAARDMKAGEELTVAYVDVTRHEDESVIDCRRRRRTELAPDSRSGPASKMSSPKLSYLTIPALRKHAATVIFAHGLGESGHVWKTFAQQIQLATPALQQTKWILLHALRRLVATDDKVAMMPSWFDDRGVTSDDNLRMLEFTDSLSDLIEMEMKSSQISSEQIFLGGYGQGGEIVLAAGLTLNKKMLSSHAKQIPIFWSVGTADAAIIGIARQSVEFLEHNGFPVSHGAIEPMGISFNIYRGLGGATETIVVGDLTKWLDNICTALPHQRL
ncbi:hypothetical protein D9757_001192 [Collybiopsis confluens]|uniref:SET domain-containing protein n=1 Tax=Collybiopsis confluens TaxID=2823264 RepID=A0A8H5I197_9AGAR|nr:hypothetical protein D9757_001192 [Collybiopsis confluens]